MKIYRELYFKGNVEQLQNFIDIIGEYATGDWALVKKEGLLKDYLLFEYTGNLINESQVSIHIGDELKRKNLQSASVLSFGNYYEKDITLKVGNIVPLKKRQLNVNEYNEVLIQFYKDVIDPFKKSDSTFGLIIDGPTDDKFDPLEVISDKALEKLKAFNASSNKTTGISHPSDRDRWFDFICETVDDNRFFDYSDLTEFLQDKDYWGDKYTWSAEDASELASNYEMMCELIIYYKNTRGK